MHCGGRVPCSAPLRSLSSPHVLLRPENQFSGVRTCGSRAIESCRPADPRHERPALQRCGFAEGNVRHLARLAGERKILSQRKIRVASHIRMRRRSGVPGSERPSCRKSRVRASPPWARRRSRVGSSDFSSLTCGLQAQMHTRQERGSTINNRPARVFAIVITLLMSTRYRSPAPSSRRRRRRQSSRHRRFYRHFAAKTRLARKPGLRTAPSISELTREQTK